MPNPHAEVRSAFSFFFQVVAFHTDRPCARHDLPLSHVPSPEAKRGWAAEAYSVA